MIELDKKKYYLLSEAAKRLGYTLGTVRQYVLRNKIPTVKVGGRHYICEDVIYSHTHKETK